MKKIVFNIGILFTILFNSISFPQIITENGPENYFPMKIGNKYQFWKFSGPPPFVQLLYFEITKDTIINSDKYYLIHQDINSNQWVRIDSVGRLFVINSDNETLIMDFSLPSGSIFNGYIITKDTLIKYGINTVILNWDQKKWCNHIGYIFNHREGWIPPSFYYSDTEKLIQATISVLDSIYFLKENYLPEFDIYSITLNNKNLIAEIGVDHYYSLYWEPPNYPELSFNYISSVSLEGYYKKIDSIKSIEPILLTNLQYTKKYSLEYELDSMLLNNGFDFYYRFLAKDKGMIPQFSTYPDTGFLKVEYVSSSFDIDLSGVIEFDLSQNYPNPFNPSTKIHFAIPTSPLNPSPYQGEGNKERFVTLKVYDVLGKEVATLVNEEKPAGNFEVEFNNVETLHATSLPSGVYFYQLKAGEFVETKKMILLR